MKMDYYLKLDDKPGKKAPGVDEGQIKYCGANCVTADVHVVSTKTQKVWVTLNTWRIETMPSSCMSEQDVYHSIQPLPNEDWAFLEANEGGTTQIGPFSMKAGEYETFSIAVAPDNRRPADWSIVAWGESGQVFVYNADGTETQHWARSESMKKIGVQGTRPKFDSSKLKQMARPNQETPPDKPDVPNPVTPDPPKFNPMNLFKK